MSTEIFAKLRVPLDQTPSGEECGYCGGDGGYRLTSGRMVDGKPVEKTNWVTCERCGGEGLISVEGEAVEGHGTIGIPESAPCPDCSQPSGEEGEGGVTRDCECKGYGCHRCAGSGEAPSDGATLIAVERQRQVGAEGFEIPSPTAIAGVPIVVLRTLAGKDQR